MHPALVSVSARVHVARRRSSAGARLWRSVRRVRPAGRPSPPRNRCARLTAASGRSWGDVRRARRVGSAARRGVRAAHSLAAVRGSRSAGPTRRGPVFDRAPWCAQRAGPCGVGRRAEAPGASCRRVPAGPAAGAGVRAQRPGVGVPGRVPAPPAGVWSDGPCLRRRQRPRRARRRAGSRLGPVLGVASGGGLWVDFALLAPKGAYNIAPSLCLGRKAVETLACL